MSAKKIVSGSTSKRNRSSLSFSKCKEMIREVQSRPSLWDKKHINYNNQEITIELWEEIGAAVGLSAKDAKLKWKTLKDSYRRTLKSLCDIPPSRSPKIWKFTESMKFIKPHLNSTLPSSLETYVDAENDKECEIYFETVDDGEIQNETPPAIEEETSMSSEIPLDRVQQKLFDKLQPPCSGPTIATESDRGGKVSQMESQNIEANSSLSDDGDYHFLMSLLPFMKALHPFAKLELRNELQRSVTKAYRAAHL